MARKYSDAYFARLEEKKQDLEQQARELGQRILREQDEALAAINMNIKCPHCKRAIPLASMLDIHHPEAHATTVLDCVPTCGCRIRVEVAHDPGRGIYEPDSWHIVATDMGIYLPEAQYASLPREELVRDEARVAAGLPSKYHLRV